MPLPPFGCYNGGMDAYDSGWRAAVLAMKEMLEPRQPDWRNFAPAWALESTPEAYHWQRGFTFGWNYLAQRRGWPTLPYVFTTPNSRPSH